MEKRSIASPSRPGGRNRYNSQPSKLSGMKLGVLLCAVGCGVFLLSAATKSQEIFSHYQGVFSSKVGQKFGLILISREGGVVGVNQDQGEKDDGYLVTLIHAGTDYLMFRMEDDGFKGDIRYYPLSMVKFLEKAAK